MAEYATYIILPFRPYVCRRVIHSGLWFKYIELIFRTEARSTSAGSGRVARSLCTIDLVVFDRLAVCTTTW